MVSPWSSPNTVDTDDEASVASMLARRSCRAGPGPDRKTSCTASDWAHDGFPAIVSYQGWSATITCPGSDDTERDEAVPRGLAGLGWDLVETAAVEVDHLHDDHNRENRPRALPGTLHQTG